MSIAKAALALMAITVVSKVAGFMREVLLAYFYGASATSDAYLVALTVPGVIYAFIGAALTVAFIPVYLGVPTDARPSFVGKLTNLVFLASTILIVATFIFAERIVWLVAPGFSEETARLAVLFTRVFVFGIYSSALINIFTGVLQAEGRLVIPALAGLAFSITVAASIALSSEFGVIILILGPLLAKLIEVVLMWPAVRRLGVRLRPRFEMSDPGVRLVVVMTAPLALGIAANEVNSVVGRALASNVAVGAVSALNYANQLNQLVIGVIGLSVATSIFPSLAKLFGDGRADAGSGLLGDALRYVVFLVVPAACFAAAFSTEIVELVYGRGGFDDQAVKMTSGALFFYALGMLWMAIREILARAFYALKDARTPVNNAIAGVVLNIGLSLVLAPRFGVSGLALATSISAAVTSFLLLFAIRRRLGRDVASAFGRDFLSLTVIGIVSVCLVKSIESKLLPVSMPGSILLQSVALFALVFLFLAWLARVDVARSSVAYMARKIEQAWADRRA